MSTKKKLIEAANKRLLMESLPPTIHFSEWEVYEMVNKMFGGKMPEEAIKILQEGLKAKGRNLDGGSAPEGAYH